MVNVGSNYELLSPHYRNSDRIIWDDAEVVRRLWDRIIQNKAVWDQFRLLDGTKHASVLGHAAAGERWYITDQGLNERMRFLKYTAGQFFRRMLFYFYLTLEQFTGLDWNFLDGMHWQKDAKLN